MFATRKLLAVGFAVHWAEYCEMPFGCGWERGTALL